MVRRVKLKTTSKTELDARHVVQSVHTRADTHNINERVGDRSEIGDLAHVAHFGG